MKLRGYQTMSPSEVRAAFDTLNEKRKKMGLSCREGGKYDYCRNVLYNARYYARKK